MSSSALVAATYYLPENTRGISNAESPLRFWYKQPPSLPEIPKEVIDEKPRIETRQCRQSGLW